MWASSGNELLTRYYRVKARGFRFGGATFCLLEIVSMKAAGRFVLGVAAASLLSATSALAVDTKPVRHLVYSFDVNFTTTSTVHDSGIGGGGSGSTDYHGGNMDQGQIVVDVLTVQPDSGLVVNVSEQGRDTRNSAPTMCVAYGHGAVICDQTHGEVNEEEMSLLRIIGRDFINHALIDNKNHWRYEQSTPDANETNDYTIQSTQGDVMKIAFQRYLKVHTGQAFEATTDGNITYNQKLTLPTSLTEDTVTRKNTGAGNYDRIEQRITLNLTSDSMQAAVNH